MSVLHEINKDNLTWLCHDTREGLPSTIYSPREAEHHWSTRQPALSPKTIQKDEHTCSVRFDFGFHRRFALIRFQCTLYHAHKDRKYTE